MNKIFFLFFWTAIFISNANAKKDTNECRLTIQKIEFRECTIKDSLLIRIIDEMLLNLDEEPEGDVYYPYSKSLIFLPQKSSYNIVLTSSPNYMPIDESSQFYFGNGYMYAFQYKGLYFDMLLDLEKDSFHKKMFDQYFELTGNRISVPYYTFFKGDVHCIFSHKFKQTFTFYISENRIWGKEFLKEWLWLWELAPR